MTARESGRELAKRIRLTGAIQRKEYQLIGRLLDCRVPTPDETPFGTGNYDIDREIFMQDWLRRSLDFRDAHD